MSKVTQVQLQGIHYQWDGQDILVYDGVAAPWLISGSVLAQIELEQTELAPIDLEAMADTELSPILFSIDFQTQQWSLSSGYLHGDIKLLDEQGQECAWLPLFANENLSPLTIDVQLIPENLLPLSIMDLSMQTEGQAHVDANLEVEPLMSLSSVSVEDILHDAECLFAQPAASTLDTSDLDTAVVLDVLNWLAVYSHHD